MEIGNKIKKVRELKNYTQEYMAERLGITQSGYSRYEKEDGDLTISQLDKISEIFNMKVEDLINFDEKNIFNNYGPNSNYANANEIVTINNGICDKERELYDKTIKLLEEQILILQERINELKSKIS